MGQGQRKPVTPIVVKRRTSGLFRVGFAEMNGWRPSMEDAHVIFMDSHCGFFGVLDGHGGDQCSKFIARRLDEELAQGVPKDDASMSSLMLRLDHEFLETKQQSGSTGTFVLVQPPVAPDSPFTLRVGNIGDSRVLLGRADGALVEHGGTDGALTTDHKPDHPNERARIERTGGEVKDVLGVARVNGDLAVSRAFGDAPYKETGGPAQEDHPVCAAPELNLVTCDPTDFIVLVCDGISEGDFPNREVIKLIAEELRTTSDPGAAAAAVCRRALAAGSKDNLSCMIVMLDGKDVDDLKRPEQELLSGAFTEAGDATFRKAYTAIVGHAGLTLAQALEKRYDDLRGLITTCERRIAEDINETEAAHEHKSRKAELTELTSEIDAFGAGPSSELEPGSPERIKYFEEWLTKADASDGGSQAINATTFFLRSKQQLDEEIETTPVGAEEFDDDEFSNVIHEDLDEEGSRAEEEGDIDPEGDEPELKRRRLVDDTERVDIPECA